MLFYYMNILLISVTKKGYIIASYNQNYNVIEGTDNMFFFTDYQKLFPTPPEQIYVMLGPGSFTNLRYLLLAAQTLSIMLNVPIKTATLYECIHDYFKTRDINILIDTGTKMVLSHNSDNQSLIDKDDLILDSLWTTEMTLQENEFFKSWPDSESLIDSLCRVCLSKTPVHIDDIQPIYSIHPTYLKSVSEI